MMILINNDLQQNKLIRSWLSLAVTALIIAGLFSVLLVALRTPFIADLIPYKNFFKTALVVHVDLSVLIWLMSISSLLAELIIDNRYHKISKFALKSCMLGTILISISPFIAESKPIINNYIPIIENIFFIIGLSLFISGSLIHVIPIILSYNKDKYHNWIYFAIFTTKMINLIGFISFFIASIKLQNIDYPIDNEYYYELLFWAIGHILQFSYVNLMIISWLVLSEISDKIFVKIPFILNLIFSIISIFGIIKYDIDTLEFKEYYTMHMRYFGGISSIIAGVIVINKIIIDKLYKNILFPPLISSMILFFIGGLIGTVIKVSNVTIPAHYHGSIVGVTIALMGLTYKIIPLLYSNHISQSKIIYNSYLYGIGQMLHIFGLAWSGGYGALRKTPGVEISYKAKIGMGIMGFGGLMAIIAGLMFVLTCVKSIYKSSIRSEN